MKPILLAVLTVPFVTPATPHDQRIAKLGYVWEHGYAHSYTPQLVDDFVTEHEMVNLGSQAWFSLVYASSGSNLRSGMRNGRAMGLMDCQWAFISGYRGRRPDLVKGRPWDRRLLMDPRFSIWSHCEELAFYHQRTGRLGWALQRCVFLPAAPDGERTMREQRRRWQPIEKRHLKLLSRYYEETAP